MGVDTGKIITTTTREGGLKSILRKGIPTRGGEVLKITLGEGIQGGTIIEDLQDREIIISVDSSNM